MRFAAISVLLFMSGLHAQTTFSGPPVSSTAAEVSEGNVVLHKDLQVWLRSKGIVSTKTNKVGDTVEFEVIHPVMAGNLVVIAKGASATGKVVEAQKATRMLRGGALRVSMESVELVTGQKAALISHLNFDGGDSGQKMNRAAMMGFAGFVAASMKKGEEAGAPGGLRVPAWVVADVSVPLDDVKSNQHPAKQTQVDTGSVFLFMDETVGPPVEAKFLIGEGHYFVPSSTAVRIDLPPGDYWIRTGRAAKNDKFGKSAAAEALHVALKGGESYYITADQDLHDQHNALLRTLPPEEGEKHVEKSQVLYAYPVAGRAEGIRWQLETQPMK